MLRGNENSSIATHEVNHALGIAHIKQGGNQSPSGGGVVYVSQIVETLAGVEIGGNNIERNQSGKTTTIGDGTLLGNSTIQSLETGKVISAWSHVRIMRRMERRKERENRN